MKHSHCRKMQEVEAHVQNMAVDKKTITISGGASES